jgi:hypothetical protein
MNIKINLHQMLGVLQKVLSLFHNQRRKMKNQILIGGQALRNLGSDRHTNDVDYLVNNTTTKDAFITSDEVDFLNANGNKFFAEIFNIESKNIQATPQSLFELKAYAFVQHCQNFNFAKADSCEYDIKFLVRNFGISASKIAKKYMTSGEYSEIVKIINSVKR